MKQNHYGCLNQQFYSLGTLNEIQITFSRDFEESRAELLLGRAVQRVLEINDRMSVFKPDSDISKLNRSAGLQPVKLHADTIFLLDTANTVSEISGGAFDCTIRPLTELWGIGKKPNYIPSQTEINAFCRLTDYRDLIVDQTSCTAFLKKNGQAVDLGGIAKGYAADEVKRILIDGGISSALINLGGNIHAVGVRPDKTPWQIGIQNPAAITGEYLGSLAVKDKTIVTSGSNERFFMENGVLYHHLIDPRTGKPAQSGLLSVTAITDSSVNADALTTALFILGMEKGMELLHRFPADAIFITDNHQVYLSEGIKDKFTMKQS